MVLETFVTCGDCECQTCLRNISCPKTDMLDNPCIKCAGIPPYAPWDTEDGELHLIECDQKKSSVRRSES